MTNFLRNKTLDYMVEKLFSLNALIYPNLLTKQTKCSTISQTTESDIVLSLNCCISMNCNSKSCPSAYSPISVWLNLIQIPTHLQTKIIFKFWIVCLSSDLCDAVMLQVDDSRHGHLHAAEHSHHLQLLIIKRWSPKILHKNNSRQNFTMSTAEPHSHLHKSI